MNSRKFFLFFFAFVSAMFGATNDVQFNQRDSSGTIRQRTITATLPITDLPSFREGFGLKIGQDVQAYDADLQALAALSGTNVIYYRSGSNTWTAVIIGSNLSFSGGTLNATGGIADGATWNNGKLAGAIEVQGVYVWSSVDTVAITSNVGTVSAAKGFGSATNDANTTLTVSTDSSAANTFLTRNLVNTDASNAHVWTLRNAAATTISTITVPAASTVPVTLRATGTAWTLHGGGGNVLDLPGNSSPTNTQVVETVNPTTGASTQSNLSQLGAAIGAVGGTDIAGTIKLVQASDLATFQAAGWFLCDGTNGTPYLPGTNGGENPVVKTANYTVTPEDTNVIFNSASPLVCTLYAASASNRRPVTITNKGAGVLTVDATGLGQINGSNTISLGTNYSFTHVPDGTNWNLN